MAWMVCRMELGCGSLLARNEPDAGRKDEQASKCICHTQGHGITLRTCVHHMQGRGIYECGLNQSSLVSL